MVIHTRSQAEQKAMTSKPLKQEHLLKNLKKQMYFTITGEELRKHSDFLGKIDPDKAVTMLALCNEG